MVKWISAAFSEGAHTCDDDVLCMYADIVVGTLSLLQHIPTHPMMPTPYRNRVMMQPVDFDLFCDGIWGLW
eukprot:m.111713 g.111713  ORF g.111713 m.111713 type:complete len:71 (+) comp17007_c0_seq40:2236-2448(+)